MKKIMTVVVALVATAGVVRAQHSTSFGLKAGLNVASVPVQDGDDFNSKFGVNFGAFAHIHVAPHFAVQPEIYYSQQGGKDGDTKLKLNYVNIPVLAQYMTNTGFRLQTGPQFGIRTEAKTKNGSVENDIKDQIESLDLSWAFGASYLTSQAWGLDVRYNAGLSNISQDNSFKARNSVFQVGVFYQFAPDNGRRHRRR